MKEKGKLVTFNGKKLQQEINNSSYLLCEIADKCNLHIQTIKVAYGRGVMHTNFINRIIKQLNETVRKGQFTTKRIKKLTIDDLKGID